MNTLTVRIESLQDVAGAIRRTLTQGQAESSAGLSFVDYETMHRVLSPKRLDIVRAMAGQGPLAYREVARRVERDFKGVHSDLTALIQAGVVDRTEDGVLFPYDALHFEFDIRASAA
jgi:predicted transcriptional regulator